MNPEILKKLAALESDLRKFAGDAHNASFTISLDATGVTYSYTTSDAAGASETFNKRVVTPKI